MSARFIGLGVGPGDPELITLKAARLIREADVVGYIANISGVSQARNIAADLLAEARPEHRELPVLMPMSEQRDFANQVYDEAAQAIEQAHQLRVDGLGVEAAVGDIPEVMC